MSSKLISRDQWKAYMDVGSAGASAAALIGEGFTSFSESKNPKEYSRQYIHERTERTDVVGYASSIAYSTDVYSEDPVILKIMEITDHEYIGTDAQVTIWLVNEWEAAEDGKMSAYERRYAVIPDGKGDGTDAMIYTGTLKAVGDLVPGSWDNKNKKFTAANSDAGSEDVTEPEGTDPEGTDNEDV